MISNGKLVNACDVPIVKLVPRNERQVSKKYLQRIEASLRAVGLIDPLVVYPQGDNYEILDGCLRYRILLEMGVETVPCLLANQREAFTANRMVNQLSRVPRDADAPQIARGTRREDHRQRPGDGGDRPPAERRLCSSGWTRPWPRPSRRAN